MARITVEDCIKAIGNRFELVACAAQRVRQIASGANVTVDADDDKYPVVALRELAAHSIDISDLRKATIAKHRTISDVETDTTEDMDIGGVDLSAVDELMDNK